MPPKLIFILLFWIGATTVCGDLQVIQEEKRARDAFSKKRAIYNIRIEEYTSLGRDLLQGTDKVKVPYATLKVIDYNVLSQTHLIDHMKRYQGNEPKALLWDARTELLWKEIERERADVLCLQEVEKDHIPSFYRKFDEYGFTGFYSHRGSDKPDGCGIFYKKNLFKLSDISVVNYFRGNKTLLDRQNSAVVVKLEFTKHPGTYIVIATTHLLYNQNRQDVKLGQMQVLLAEIDRIAYKEENEYYPVILTGDFNIPPDSGILKLIQLKELKYHGLSGKTLNPDRVPSHGIYLSFQLLPPWLGIEDSCQYRDVREAREQGLPDPRKIQNIEEYAAVYNILNIDNTTVLPPEEEMNLLLNRSGKYVLPNQDYYETVEINDWEVIKDTLLLKQHVRSPRPEDELIKDMYDPRDMFHRCEDIVKAYEKNKMKKAGKPIFSWWEAFKHWIRLRRYPNESLYYNQISNKTKEAYKMIEAHGFLGFGEKERYRNLVEEEFNTTVWKPYRRRCGTGTLSHKFRFSSVYNDAELDKVQRGNNFRQKMFTYDYIFYTGATRGPQSKFKGGDLHLLSRLKMPTVGEFYDHFSPIPNLVLGSDHLSLTATFLLCVEKDA